MDLSKLKEPFAPEDIEWRIQQSGVNSNGPWGMCLAYVQNRAIMDKLDDVCGPGNWKNEFKPAPDGGILCGISILLPTIRESEWVTKWDGAENTDIEKVKGGLSNAMKRAAVQWGIGRYLYGLETGWAKFSKTGKYTCRMKDKSYHKWDPPPLPAWALPSSKPTPKNDETFLPEQQHTMTNEAFLKKMEGFRKFETQAYWKVMGSWRMKKAEQITNPEAQAGILKEITDTIVGG